MKDPTDVDLLEPFERALGEFVGKLIKELLEKELAERDDKVPK